MQSAEHNPEKLENSLDELLGEKSNKRVKIIIYIVMGSCLALLIGFGANKVSQNSVSPNVSTSPSTASLNTTGQSCVNIRTDVTMIRTLFDKGDANLDQTVALLDSAASDWRTEALKFQGSKAAWLNKMAELSDKIGSYLLTGSPSNGNQLLNQLFANMNLVNQFCN